MSQIQEAVWTPGRARAGAHAWRARGTRKEGGEAPWARRTTVRLTCAPVGEEEHRQAQSRHARPEAAGSSAHSCSLLLSSAGRRRAAPLRSAPRLDPVCPTRPDLPCRIWRGAAPLQDLLPASTEGYTFPKTPTLRIRKGRLYTNFDHYMESGFV